MTVSSAAGVGERADAAGRWAPTAALVRSAALGVALVVAAAVLGRLDLAVLATPFVVHGAWALLTRPGTTPTARVRARQQALAEGRAARIGVRLNAPAPQVVAAWGDVPGDWAARSAVLDAKTDDVTLRLTPDRWGRHRLPGATVVLSDAAWAWRATLVTEETGLLVRPAALDLVGGSGVARPIGVTGQHTSAAPGDGSALSHVREFRPGDRLRRINWRVTSRKGGLHVNATLTDRDTHVLIVTDTGTDLPGVEREEATSLDLMARAVAAISQHYLGLGDRVRVHDLARRIPALPAGSGPRQARSILEALGRMERGGRARTPDRRVESLVPGTLVFFCSPLLHERAITELVRLTRGGAEVVCIDTFPERLGTKAGLPRRSADESWAAEAWQLRRLGRTATITGLNRIGVPVVPWRGPASLGGVLLAMAQARSAPRAGARG
ncbi:DUF58 domain-containing protein [Propioniciclava soli]|uniref:DUF58 domain-containing protein n=1 Tax=Propioniciclava soli TaxID=2775081 RepID=UPI001E4A906D